MKMKAQALLTILHLLSFLPNPSSPSSTTRSSSPDSFIYAGCTQIKYNPATPYRTNVDSILSSLLSSASTSTFKASTNRDLVYGLFQCRGDLSSSDCHSCVANAVSRLGSFCVGTAGAAMQLDGCFVKYDNVSFLGAQDKTVVYNKCGDPAPEPDGERKDEVLDYLRGGGAYFRVRGSGGVQGMGQCMEDLSEVQCQDCLSEATQRLQTECATSPWGDMFLGKCYVRYYQTYTPSPLLESDEDDEPERTLAIIIGVIAAAALLVVFLSFLGKSIDNVDKEGT